MTVSLKDGFKLLGIAVMSGCAVFVCTFFLNFYLDARAVRDAVEPAVLPLYEAQLFTAKFTSAISGGCLLAVSVVLLVFYVKLYVNAHAKQLGILKALGFGRGRLALGFWIFGMSVLAGTAIGFGCGYAISPLIYTQMGGDGLPAIPVRFHAELLALLVLLPSVAFAALAVLTAFVTLRRSAADLMRGKEKIAKSVFRSELPFPKELRRATLKSRKSLAFFVAFACFCFSSMLQMSASMGDYSSVTMGVIIFGIGVVLAATALLLAFTSLVNANVRTVSVMKAHGYTLWQCGAAVLGGYRLPAYIGFAVGTLYQYGLLKMMLEVIFRGMDGIPAYHFQVGTFFAVLGAFAVLYELAVLVFTRKMGKASIRALMAE